jgi:hypothetical protein
MVSPNSVEYADQRRSDLIKKQAGKPGLRGNINAKCIECIYDPMQKGSWRWQVENCTCDSCPLFQVRPLTVSL